MLGINFDYWVKFNERQIEQIVIMKKGIEPPRGVLSEASDSMVWRKLDPETVREVVRIAAIDYFYDQLKPQDQTVLLNYDYHKAPNRKTKSISVNFDNKRASNEDLLVLDWIHELARGFENNHSMTVRKLLRALFYQAKAMVDYKIIDV